MKTRKPADLPGDLESSRRRFEQWRRRRRGRTPIPEALWAEAVTLAGRYGVSRTARTLRVGYRSLKERVAREADCWASTSPMPSKPAFLELAIPSQAGAGECLLEWEDAAGAKMRLHLKGGVEVPDLVALSRSFWEGLR
jgi:hypothetical protein